jgi:hypothetical protein
MKIPSRAFAVLLVALLAADRAQAADVYCRHGGIRIHDGGEFEENWYVVNSAARHPQRPGETRPTTGCGINWRSVGALYRPPEIIEAPRLGSARVVNNYRIFYQSARSGQDRLTTRIHWKGASSGQPQSAIVHYNITVSDQPL